jgi:hypothetical protein
MLTPGYCSVERTFRDWFGLTIILFATALLLVVGIAALSGISPLALLDGISDFIRSPN